MSGRAATTDVIPGKYALAVGIPDKTLAPGWIWRRLTDVAEMATGHTPSRNHPSYWDGDIAWIGIKDARAFHGRRITTTFQTVTQAGIDNSASVLLPANTVCLSRTASVGYVTIMDRPMATSQDFVNWKCSEALMPEFLMYLLIAERDSLFKFGKGTTHTTIYFPEAKALSVGLPPVGEQRRIVAKIEELFSDLDAGVAALERVRANLKRYRSAVLKAAVEGRLTDEWRTRHPNARSNAPRSLPPNSAGKKRAGRLWGAGFVPELTSEERSQVPTTWTWTKVKDLGPNPEEVVQVGPMSMKSSEFAESGIPVLNVGCIKWDWIDESKLDFLPETIASRFDRYRVRSGDVLFTRSGTVGRCAVASGEQDGWLMTFHLLRARPDPSMCQPRFLRMLFEGASHIRRQRENGSVGSTRAGFNTNLLASLDVPLPPFAEQSEIVAEVDRRLSVADAAEKEVEHALQRAARLRQAILKRAFEGKLVPQDPTDEPAKQFIERGCVGVRADTMCSTRAATPRRRRTRVRA